MSETSNSNASSTSSQEPTKGRRPRSDDRRAELAQIACRLIAENGLEGFRTRHVAAAAGIDTGTLHYHYSSKEALVQAVVDHLVADLRVNRAGGNGEPVGALNELLAEVHDVALRVRHSPQQFRVLLDLRLHAARSPAIAKILNTQDYNFHKFLMSLLSRGIEQRVFRTDIDLELTASVLRAELMGLSVAALLAPKGVEEIAAALCRQIEVWLLAVPSE